MTQLSTLVLVLSKFFTSTQSISQASVNFSTINELISAFLSQNISNSNFFFLNRLHYIAMNEKEDLAVYDGGITRLFAYFTRSLWDLIEGYFPLDYGKMLLLSSKASFHSFTAELTGQKNLQFSCYLPTRISMIFFLSMPAAGGGRYIVYVDL